MTESGGREARPVEVFRPGFIAAEFVQESTTTYSTSGIDGANHLPPARGCAGAHPLETGPMGSGKGE